MLHGLTTFIRSYFLALNWDELVYRNKVTVAEAKDCIYQKFLQLFGDKNCQDNEMPATTPVKDLDHLLRETLGPNLKIENINWKPLTDPGENYGSLIYSVDATIKREGITEILNLVVKLPPSSQCLIDLFNSPINFWKELIFYREIAPKFIQFQLASGIKKERIINLIPRYYGGRLGLKNPNVFDDQAAVIMENLIPKGYTVRDRLLGLDLEHTELAVKELARLHAIVIGLKIKCPGFFKDIIIPALVDPTNDMAREGNIGMVKEAHDAYKEFPEAEPHINRINRTLISDYETGYTNSEPSEPWGTMVHNDFWSNNFLFKYNNENKPIGFKIVDFQFGYYESGALDLIFLLLSSAQEEVLNDNLDDMVDRYYKSFINCLKSLKVDTKDFSRKSFHQEINRCAPLRFGHCISMVNIITATRGSMKGVEEMNGEVNFSSGENRENAKKKLLHILQIFLKKQWLVE